MKKLKTILTIGVIFAMVFTVFPAFSGDMNAYAATPKKITLKITGNDSYSVTLKWNKCKSPKKGYAVFRNGSCIKRLNTKTTSYKVSCRPGDSYTYQIKNWTSKKQYYNTKKKKWQNSKPKKSQWKGKQTRYKYTYSNASNSIAVANARLSQSISAFNVIPLSGYSTANDILVNGSVVQVDGGTVFKITASSTSGGALTFTSSNSGVASIDGSGIVTAKSKGSTNITIKQGGTKEYNSASKTVRVDVTGKAQTINHGGNKTLNIGDNYKLNATASSGLPLTYTSANSSIATVDETGKVHAVRSGRTNIHIRQAGNDVYSPKEVVATITVRSANINIKFNGNGATSGSMSNQTLTNGTGHLIPNTFTKNGYKFKGWDTNANATSPRWLDNGTFTQVSDEPITITLYAIWEKSNESIVITEPFTITYPYKNGSDNVVDLNNPVTLNSSNMNIPSHVSKITWKVQSYGMADGSNTVTIVNNVSNGKDVTLYAEDALSSKNTLGQVKIVATFTMEDGYVYYDKNNDGTVDENDRTASFIVTNTLYPLVGSISNKTYDFKSFNRPIVSSARIRSFASLYKSLPNNSTINININEWNENYDNISLYFTGTWSIEDFNNKDCNIILTKSDYHDSIDLVKAGDFKLTFDNGRSLNIHLTGQNDYMIRYFNHLSSIRSQYKANNEIDTIKHYIAYIISNSYYKQGGNIWETGYGDCGAGNKYLADLLRYSGIRAFMRDAAGEIDQEHNNTAVVLSNGQKYVADGTPYTQKVPSYSQALTLIESKMNDPWYSAPIVSWEVYYADFGYTPTFY